MSISILAVRPPEGVCSMLGESYESLYGRTTGVYGVSLSTVYTWWYDVCGG